MGFFGYLKQMCLLKKPLQKNSYQINPLTRSYPWRIKYCGILYCHNFSKCTYSVCSASKNKITLVGLTTNRIFSYHLGQKLKWRYSGVKNLLVIVSFQTAWPLLGEDGGKQYLFPLGQMDREIPPLAEFSLHKFLPYHHQ